MNTYKICEKCLKSFSVKNIRRHEKGCGIVYNCKHCDKLFTNQFNGKRHEAQCLDVLAEKKPKLWEPKKNELKEKIGQGMLYSYETAFKNRIQSWFLRKENTSDLIMFLNSSRDDIKKVIQEALQEFTSVKTNLVVECSFINMNGEEQDKAFKTKNKAVYRETNLEKVIDEFVEKLKTEMEEAQLEKSGWSLKEVDGLRVRINKNNPLKGSTYIRLPKEIQNKKACVNVQNKDSKCFKYSVLAEFIDENPERVSKYINLKHPYDFSCVDFPTPLNQIKIFEQRNNISINVFGLEKYNKVFPLKVVKQELADHRDLLLINDDSGTSHYVYIKNFEQLVRRQMTKFKKSIVICKRCFTKFDDRYQGYLGTGKTKEEKLEEHLKYCNSKEPTRVELPSKKIYVGFENVEKFLKLPYVIYADFESILEPSERQPNPKGHSTHIQKHTPMSYCLYLKISDEVKHVPSNLPTEPITYRGKDAGSHFVQQLKVIGEEVSRLYSINKPMEPLTQEEEESYLTANHCYLCEKSIGKEVKIRDHCHITGKYRGPAHNCCNLRCQAPDFLPVFIHNLSGYDSHIIVKEIGYDDKHIEVIPSSEEKYISFSKRINEKIKIRFVDTFRFMNTSLDELVKNLPKLQETSKFYTSEALNLMKRKGVFPYEYVSSWEKLEETHLPPKKAFFSKLSGCDIEDEDYQHAQSIWNYFNFKNLGEYSDHYLKTDVLLLADVFENFRETIHKTHKLDPAHYFTIPGLTWDAMLKYTGVNLELLRDYDMILMIEKGIRGGICQASHRYAKANNSFMKDFDPNKESTFISYQDCNNLYGQAMSRSLPYGGFKWCKEEVDVTTLNEDDENGYILEVDIEYPKKLHKLHNDLPFLPENTLPPGGKNKKLIPHLGSRQTYVVHYLALKQAIAHGLKVTKTHRVLKFKQSRWLSSYISFNTELRKNAKNEFEKDLFKLMNNAVFGKTMENIRKRVNIKLVSNENLLEKLIAKPEFLDVTIYSENLAAVHMMKKSIVYNKPIYIGLSVLDLSKTTMYEYHYDIMIPQFRPENLKLMYMDTDSFIYLIKTKNLFVDMLEMLEHMDTSDYPIDHPCFSLTNKKVLGKFKDEMKGEIIDKFIALRAKMYAISRKDKEIKKIKGISKSVVKNHIRFEHYEESLFSQTTIRTPMVAIQSKKHNITTTEINKIALSPFDDKRKILPDGISTLAHGYMD